MSANVIAYYSVYVTYCMLTICLKSNIILGMNIIKVFANNVRKYRTLSGLSQEEFADKCGLHRTYISAVECYRRSIALENIQKIANALNIETYKLFMEESQDGSTKKQV